MGGERRKGEEGREGKEGRGWERIRVDGKDVGGRRGERKGERMCWEGCGWQDEA